MSVKSRADLKLVFITDYVPTQSDFADVFDSFWHHSDEATRNLATVATTGRYDDLIGRPTLSTVALTGSYTALGDLPTLGTASARNVAMFGDAAPSQVVLGSDTRLNDARAPLAHTHDASDIIGIVSATNLPTLTGDVTTTSGSTVTTIPAKTITYSKIQDVTANRLLGRISGGSGSPEEITPAQATGMLDTFIGDVGGTPKKGLVPVPSVGDANKVMFGDGTWRKRTHPHVQSGASAIWTINHGMGGEPNITVIDSAGSEIIGDVEYISASTVRVTFTSALSGRATLTL